ncbi:MAG: CehA/McbA family metallohydrolase, partial [Verrucomicrobiota bacterium]
AGVTAPLRIASEEPEILATVYGDNPVVERLSGAILEYRLLLLRGNQPGKIATVLQFDVGQGTQDLGYRAELIATFDCQSSTEVKLKVVDEDGEPTIAAFEIRDVSGKTWPTQANRVEPDFRFHPQVYRGTGESVEVPPGDYQFRVTRGPEYYPIEKEVRVGTEPEIAEFRLERWIDPSDYGWWSGDHHIHAAGCKHYESPSQGVHAAAMMRHCVGEDLKIGANLTWGPCFDYQKQFFTGRIDPVSRYPYLLRYDVEVSGFGSHRSGHLCLLRLKHQIFPGGDSLDHWPTLCLNTLKWAQKQGAVCGPAHSGWGLAVKSNELPNYEIPPFDGIGANEYIVDVTHEVEGPDGSLVPAVDFLSTVDTPYIWELNIWYHTLNCGFRTRISGETDFPCIYDERVGLGRSYIKLDDKLTYDAWCEGISKGRGYVSDGRSHLIDFAVNGAEVGVNDSEVHLDEPGPISITAKVAGFLDEDPIRLNETGIGRLERSAPTIAAQPYAKKPFWHLERARLGETREVSVEIVVNGEAVASQTIAADGSLSDLHFPDIPISQSSWVALRILPSSHTNPVFVIVDEEPIRASSRSAQWCLEGVEQCWSQKANMIAPEEMEDAIAAYDHARAVYRKILTNSVAP